MSFRLQDNSRKIRNYVIFGSYLALGNLIESIAIGLILGSLQTFGLVMVLLELNVFAIPLLIHFHPAHWILYVVGFTWFAQLMTWRSHNHAWKEEKDD